MRQFESVRSVDNVHECLQLESPSSNILVMVKHRELECRLHLVRALFENGT